MLSKRFCGVRSDAVQRSNNQMQIKHAALVLFALGTPWVAQACTSVYPGQEANLVVDAWDDTEPDVLVASWRNVGNVSFLSGCTSVSTSIPIDARMAAPGLQYVRTVTLDGQSYPAFGLSSHPRSPLLIFRHTASSSSGGQPSLSQPFDIRVGVQVRGHAIASPSRWSFVSVAAVSRGGDMQAVPRTTLGTAMHVSPDFPHMVKTDTYHFTANLRTKTCTLTDKAVTLDDVPMEDLPAPDSTAAEQDFNVVMRCNGAFPVSFTLTDAIEPSNTGTRLRPTPRASAQGVRVQLLRERVPVVLGQSWLLPESSNGAQDIALSARYYRESGSFFPGVVEGQAILTATYR
ncbi:fimbrial protein [Stenotrophomonas sp.]|uniref:fimbrial protein n=1 Tax=Stenotrophomonas sp. TaxID=69392 RepID=UPI0028A85D67|nr:fimbrial protein [Stenotrophomonas sp.]